MPRTVPAGRRPTASPARSRPPGARPRAWPLPKRRIGCAWSGPTRFGTHHARALLVDGAPSTMRQDQNQRTYKPGDLNRQRRWVDVSDILPAGPKSQKEMLTRAAANPADVVDDWRRAAMDGPT